MYFDVNLLKGQLGAWVGQLVEHLTLNFGSGHGPGVLGPSPELCFMLSVEPVWDILSLFLCVSLSVSLFLFFSPPPIHSLSLSNNK